MGLPPSSFGLAHFSVTDLLSKSVISGSPGWLGGPGRKGYFHQWNFDNDFAMLTVGVLCQDWIAGEYWLGLTLLVDGGDFELVEVAWFQALGSGAAAARLRKGNISI